MDFIDNRKWGSYTYLDLLEQNSVRFTYDGTTLTFLSPEDEEQAIAIWYALTGMRTIGRFADGDNAK